MWIKFAHLCRKSGRYGLSQKILAQLLNSDGKEPEVLVFLHYGFALFYLCS
jgi:hypothetical protein